MVRLTGGESGSDCGSRLRLGEESFVGGPFLGDALRCLLAAKTEQTAAAACPMHPRTLVVSRHDLLTSTTASQKESNGRPSMRSALSRATISDSVEEWETTVCMLQTAFRRNYPGKAT